MGKGGVKKEAKHGGVRSNNFATEGGRVKESEVLWGQHMVRDEEGFTFTFTRSGMKESENIRISGVVTKRRG